MMIGQNEITSNRLRKGVCVDVRDVSVTRHLMCIFLWSLCIFMDYMGCNENYKALSNPSHISQFYAILKVLSNHKSTNNKYI